MTDILGNNSGLDRFSLAADLVKTTAHHELADALLPEAQERVLSELGGIFQAAPPRVSSEFLVRISLTDDPDAAGDPRELSWVGVAFDFEKVHTDPLEVSVRETTGVISSSGGRLSDAFERADTPLIDIGLHDLNPDFKYPFSLEAIAREIGKPN